MRSIIFTADDRRALARDRYHHPDPRLQRKMEVLWLKSHGLNHDPIAAYADVSRRTVQRYLDQYIEGGLSRLRQGRWHQPRSALTEHRSSLEEYFATHPVRSAEQAWALHRAADRHPPEPQPGPPLPQGRSRAALAQDRGHSGT